MHYSVYSSSIALGIVTGAYSFCPLIAKAQPLPDTTLPNNSQVNLEDNTYQIDGGTQIGDNLFHSFEEFSVPQDSEALFNNDLAVQNIFSRVTGNSVSNIDGAVSANGDANLLIINPNGILFGSNSSLNIGGSFLATTAESLQFADGTEFSATNTQTTPLLTISTPIGLQFGDDVGRIINRAGIVLNLDNFTQEGGLTITSGNTIALVGGEILFEGGFIGDRVGEVVNVELGSVDSSSNVTIIPTDSGWTFDYQDVENFQDISFTSSNVNPDGFLPINAVIRGDLIRIFGEDITFQQGRQLSSNRTIEVNASGTLEITGTTPLFGSTVPTGLGANVFTDAEGGDILVNSRNLIVRDGGRITNKVADNSDPDTGEVIPASGDAGDIIINVTESIEISGADGEFNSGIFSSTEGSGSAGKITIETKDLTVADEAEINAGSIGETFGGVPIATGLAGEIEINATGSIKLDNGFISSSSNGEGGNAGNLIINTSQLTVANGGVLNISATGTGEAGSLNISSQNITLNNGLINAETRSGSRGNITIDKASTLLLRDNSKITTNALTSATGGDIEITADTIVGLEDSDITANAQQGQAGRVIINSDNGIIGIFIRETESSDSSDITATSELGVDFNGEIILNTPDVDPNSGIIELSDTTIDTEAILAKDLCRLEDGKIAKGSSFTITGRGGLTPTSEDSTSNINNVVGWANREDIEVSQNGTVGVRQRSETETQATKYPVIQQSQGWVTAADGSVWLVANAPETAPQNTKLNHPDCQVD